MIKTVDISDMKISNNENDILVTYSLGSCVGLTLYDPIEKIGSLIHCMLPLSKIDKEKAQKNPYMFVDTGLTKMLQEMYDRGAKRKNIIAKLAGGAKLLDKKNIFNVGERNIVIVRKILWKNDILIQGMDVGGSKSRTVRLYMDSGRTTVRNKGEEYDI
ncbi:MAG: chemotaxis protein CheD [Candidatus Marinimicrobia bacterium]|nr:chemotaxis protein CheD [Candidatus Neomarinimicrobiota bacterium]